MPVGRFDARRVHCPEVRPLQSRVLNLELPKPLDRIQRAESAPPDLDALFADLVFPRHLGERRLADFLQHRNHLLFSEMTLLHWLVARWREPFSQVMHRPKNLAGQLVVKIKRSKLPTRLPKHPILNFLQELLQSRRA